MSSTRSTRWAIRSYGVVELRRTTPVTLYPFDSRSSARYEPSWPVIPVISAFGRVRTLDRKVASAHGSPGQKKGGSMGAPLYSPTAGQPSRHRHTARRTLDLPGVQAARADLDLLHLAIDEDARDLEIGLPDAARLVVRMRDVVAEGNALVAYVAAIACH